MWLLPKRKVTLETQLPARRVMQKLATNYDDNAFKNIHLSSFYRYSFNENSFSMYTSSRRISELSFPSAKRHTFSFKIEGSVVDTEEGSNISLTISEAPLNSASRILFLGFFILLFLLTGITFFLSGDAFQGFSGIFGAVIIYSIDELLLFLIRKRLKKIEDLITELIVY